MTWEEIERAMAGDPVRSLQFMLRRLALRYHTLPELVLDGEFGEQTLESVMRFQKALGLPVNGVVDSRTGQAILDEWRVLEQELSQSRQLRGFPRDAVVRPGESAAFLYPVQAMFQSLTHALEGIQDETIDGIHNGTSVENALWLQNLAGLPETGNVDRELWDRLARLYELFSVIEAEEHRWARPMSGRG